MEIKKLHILKYFKVIRLAFFFIHGPRDFKITITIQLQLLQEFLEEGMQLSKT